ncbi:MAG: glycosyltransferase family 4 protein [Acidimicrobiales bacterium]
MTNHSRSNGLSTTVVDKAQPEDRLHVALLCPYSLSIPGGVQGQVVGLAAELGRLGHDVTVLAPGSYTAGDFRFQTLGRSIALPANGSVAPVALGPRASVLALRALRKGRFDVLHMHEPFALGASYACLLFSRQALVGTFHRSGGSALYTVLRPLTRPLAKRMRVLCAVSPQALETAARALGGTYELIPNGVDVRRFMNADPWPTTAPTIMFVGRHEERKGLAILLEAFSKLNNRRAVLWVAGLGPDTDRLREMYPPTETIQWLGRIGDGELARRLRGADVACFPSIAGESFGVVLLEAMAARCSVVASDIPGYRAVAQRVARLFTPGDASELARLLADAVADSESSTGASSEEALDRGTAVAESFSMEKMARRYVTVYEAALGYSAL